MRRTLVAALAISAALVVLSTGNSSADTGGDIEPRDDGSYEICGRYVCYSFFEQVFYDYTINMTVDGEIASFSIFDQVQLSDLQVQGPPKDEGGIYLIDGLSGTSRAYDVPTGVMSFQTHVVNTVSFEMPSQMGAILSDNSALIGYDDFRGDLVLLGSGTMTWGSNHISLEMEPGDMYYFRASYMYSESLGPDIVDGSIAGELYLDATGENLASYVVDYQPIDMEVQYSTETELEITADASFQDGKTVILTLDDSAFDVPLDELRVELDGNKIEMAENPREVISSSEEGYYSLQNDEATQIFIHIPHFSQRTITLSKIGPEEIGFEVYLGATASILLVVAATVFLFRRKD